MEDVLHQVVVGEHDALGLTGGAGCVDDGHEVAGLDPIGAVPEGSLVILAHLRFYHFAEGADALFAWTFDLDQMLDGAALFLDRDEFRHLLRILCHDNLGSRVLDLVGDLLRREGAVNGHIDGADREGGDVDHVPLGAVVREQHHPISCDHAKLGEHTRQSSGSAEELSSRKNSTTFWGPVRIVLTAGR